MPVGPPHAPPRINFIEITSCATITRARVSVYIISGNVYIWRMRLTAYHLPTFPNLRWNKFPHLPPGKSTVLFLGVSRFLRDSPPPKIQRRSAIIGITAGLKFRFRSSGTNCVNLRQYAIRSCLRFPSKQVYFRKRQAGALESRWKTEECWIPSFISLRCSRDDFNSGLLNVIVTL